MRLRTDGSLAARYTYDASGYRLGKFNPANGLTTYYLRDGAGQTLSEFRRIDLPTVQPTWLKDYVYAVGRHVAMVENETPATPGGISVVASQPGGTPYVSLQWAATGDLDILQYHVDRTSGSSTETFLVEWDSAREYYDVDVSEGTTYTYKVSVEDTAGQIGGYSENVVVMPGDPNNPDSPTPGAITAGDGRIDLAWTAPVDADLWSFQLYRKEGSESYSPVGGLLHHSQTAVTDATVINDHTYDYQIEAIDTAGRHSLAVPAAPNWQATPRDITPPEVPQGLFALAAVTQVDLYWRPSVAGDFAKFEVYRSDSPITPDATGGKLTPDPTTAQFTDTSGITAHNRYYYRIRAVDGTNNASALSEQLVVDSRDPNVPAPAVSEFVWDYCRTYEGAINCFLPHNTELIGPVNNANHRGYYSHENFRESTLTWSAGASGATLTGFRMYSRKRLDEPYQLVRDVAKPSPTAGPTCDLYPMNAVCASQYTYKDFGFDADDACQPTYWRFSAVGTVDGQSRESLLTSTDITLPSTLRVPENLLVPAEPISSACNINTADCPQREDPAYYGLTLSWKQANSSCSGTIAGYHVYRRRHEGGPMPPIRLSRQPVTTTSFRVDYLPLIGRKAANNRVPTKVFGGTMGSDADGYGSSTQDEDGPKSYSVTTVDIYGNESAFSYGVQAHTNATAITNKWNGPWYTGDPPVNWEDRSQGSFFSIPPMSGVAAPTPPTGFSWTWKYGRSESSPSPDVGPAAGNWVLAKWTLPATGMPNEFALMQHKASDPDPSHYVEVPMDFIPGDDRGIRQFIWTMPLELACEDASYAMQTWDIYGRSSALSAPTGTIARKRLIPENPTATASANAVTISWDALQKCGLPTPPTGHELTGYAVYRSAGDNNDCTGSDPGGYAQLVPQLGPDTTSLNDSPTPTSKAYWYRVKSIWTDGQSDYSAAWCISANGSKNSGKALAMNAPSGGSEESWRVAEASAAESESAVVTSGGMVSETAASPHRTIGQANPAVRLSFYHLDHLGTPRVITDVNGQVVSKHKYLPFGEELFAPPSTNTHEFTGHERDAETGLDYMLRRFYGAGLGRFTSADLLEFRSPGTSLGAQFFVFPQLWNKYTYARNNPVDHLDPDGLFAPPYHVWLTQLVLYSMDFTPEASKIVEQANVAQDFDPSAWDADSPTLMLHAMTPAGMAPNDARAGHAQAVSDLLDSAVASGLDGDVEASLSTLGKALHAVQDQKHEFVGMDQHGAFSQQTKTDWKPSASLLGSGVNQSFTAMRDFQSRFFKAGWKKGMKNKDILKKYRELQKGSSKSSSTKKKSSGTKGSS